MSNVTRHSKDTTIAGKSMGGKFATATRTEPCQAALSAPIPLYPPWRVHQHQRSLRGHDFYPSEKLLAQVPGIYSKGHGPVGIGGQICYARHVTFSGSFMMTEFDPETGSAFGVHTDQYGDSSLGYYDLVEHEKSRSQEHGLPRVVERDLDFVPQRAATMLSNEFAGKATQRLSRLDNRVLESTYERWRQHEQDTCGSDIDPLESGRLKASWQKHAKRFGIELNPTNVDTPFRRLTSINRDDWTDAELEAVLSKI